MIKPFYEDLGVITKIKDEARKDKGLRDWELHFQVRSLSGGACTCVVCVQSQHPNTQ